MYGTATSFLYRTIGSEAWPHYYNQEQNIIPLERALLYEYVKTDVYEKQLRLGMLSPYAEPFNLETERLVHEKDKPEKVNNKQNEMVLEINQKKKESKDITRSGKNTE